MLWMAKHITWDGGLIAQDAFNFEATRLMPMHFLGGLLLSMLLFRFFLPIAHRFKLLDKPDYHRKTHREPIPLIGGLVVVLSVLLSCWSIAGWLTDSGGFAFLVCLMLLVLLGTLDDFFDVHARPKLGLQFLVSTVYVFYFMNVGVDFRGLFGLGVLNEIWSKIFLSLMFVFLINAFNLIDGINTLLGVFVLLAFLFFAWFFWQIEDWNRYYISFAFCGSLLVFLWFNLTPARVFMGDAGSMALGFVLSDFVGQFLFYHNQVWESNLHSTKEHTPVLALALFSLPIFDMIRVIVLRLLGGRFPMLPGRDHMHHFLLDRGWTHVQASLALNGTSISLFLVTCLMAWAGWDINLVFWLVLGLTWLAFPGSGRSFLARRWNTFRRQNQPKPR